MRNPNPYFDALNFIGIAVIVLIAVWLAAQIL